ncbi:hypothetical protein K1T71_008660 [Dendrolimus kikuchii]|uniref:Uncharacterized protein n=1 Tax=Dendrolimus kikuchii TaxID=765133 RepID=A0ACC1CV01_9NEOP|nr:hypothetical protein K1T71_008660 [Dendrolimus kikuchii]
MDLENGGSSEGALALYFIQRHVAGTCIRRKAGCEVAGNKVLRHAARNKKYSLYFRQPDENGCGLTKFVYTSLKSSRQSGYGVTALAVPPRYSSLGHRIRTLCRLFIGIQRFAARRLTPSHIHSPFP